MTGIYEDGTYLAHNPTWHEEDSPWKARQIHALMERNALAPRTVCEVGCGAGEVLRQLGLLLPPGVSLVGTEISPQAHARCATRAGPDLRFVLGDILEEDDGEVFDLVMAIDVVEHVEDCYGFLRRLRRRGRHAILQIPLDLSVQTVLRSSPLLKGRRTAGHLHLFTKETALETLRDTGYEIIDTVYTGGALDLPHRGWKANLLRVPRRLGFAVHRDLTVRILGGYSLLVLAR